MKREELRLKTFGDVVWRWDIESQEVDKVVWNDTPWRVTAPFVSVEFSVGKILGRASSGFRNVRGPIGAKSTQAGRALSSGCLLASMRHGAVHRMAQREVL